MIGEKEPRIRRRHRPPREDAIDAPWANQGLVQLLESVGVHHKNVTVAFGDAVEHGIAQLPRDCRPAIRAARLVYAEIGRELERLGLNSINHRAYVTGRRKLALIARASGAALIAPADPTLKMDALPANQFLVEAASETAVTDQTAKSGRRS